MPIPALHTPGALLGLQQDRFLPVEYLKLCIKSGIKGFKCTIATHRCCSLCLGLSKNVLPGAICSAAFKMSDITPCCRHIKDGGIHSKEQLYLSGRRLIFALQEERVAAKNIREVTFM